MLLGNGSVGLAGSGASLATYNFVPPENQYRRSYFGAGSGPEVSVCNATFAFPWMFPPPQPIVPGIPSARFLQVSADGKKMDDSYTIPGSENVWRWHFVAQRE